MSLSSSPASPGGRSVAPPSRPPPSRPFSLSSAGLSSATGIASVLAQSRSPGGIALGVDLSSSSSRSSSDASLVPSSRSMLEVDLPLSGSSSGLIASDIQQRSRVASIGSSRSPSSLPAPIRSPPPPPRSRKNSSLAGEVPSKAINSPVSAIAASASAAALVHRVSVESDVRPPVNLSRDRSASSIKDGQLESAIQLARIEEQKKMQLPSRKPPEIPLSALKIKSPPPPSRPAPKKSEAESETETKQPAAAQATNEPTPPAASTPAQSPPSEPVPAPAPVPVPAPAPVSTPVVSCGPASSVSVPPPSRPPPQAKSSAPSSRISSPRHSPPHSPIPSSPASVSVPMSINVIAPSPVASPPEIPARLPETVQLTPNNVEQEKTKTKEETTQSQPEPVVEPAPAPAVAAVSAPSLTITVSPSLPVQSPAASPSAAHRSIQAELNQQILGAANQKPSNLKGYTALATIRGAGATSRYAPISMKLSPSNAAAEQVEWESETARRASMARSHFFAMAREQSDRAKSIRRGSIAPPMAAALGLGTQRFGTVSGPSGVRPNLQSIFAPLSEGAEGDAVTARSRANTKSADEAKPPVSPAVETVTESVTDDFEIPSRGRTATATPQEKENVPAEEPKAEVPAPAAEPSVPSSESSNSVSASVRRHDEASRRARRIEDDYKILYDIPLGQGASATVYLCESLKTKEEFAVKIIDKNLHADMEKFKEEIAINAMLNHKYIIKLQDTYEDDTYFWIVTEIACGGELFDRILHTQRFPEKEAGRLIVQLLEAVAYLHGLGIIHRDLKPENILMETSDPESNIKLSDFGFAKNMLVKRLRANSSLGTQGYAAPEVFSGQDYTEKADLWSVGIIAYIMLCGVPPFCDIDSDNSVNEPFWLYVNQMEERPDRGIAFPDKLFEGVSDSAKHFLAALLEVDPRKRLSAVDAFSHPWIKRIQKLNARQKKKQAQQQQQQKPDEIKAPETRQRDFYGTVTASSLKKFSKNAGGAVDLKWSDAQRRSSLKGTSLPRVFDEPSEKESDAQHAATK